MVKKTVFILCIFFLSFAVPAFAQNKTQKSDVRTHYELGNFFYQQGRFEEAQVEYQKALDVLKQSEQISAAVPKEEKVPTKAAPAVPTEPVKKEKRPSITEYTVGDDDSLKIAVWQNPDLDQEVIVRPDGMISFPLIGDIEARGLTIKQLTQEMTQRLSEFVRQPQVSISLRKMGGSKVIVLGEITRPGVYAVTGARTILEAVGLAGGFTRDAVPSSIILIRNAFTSPKAQKINLSKALAGRDIQAQNVILQPEDIVFVPKKAIANLNYFLEEFLGPLYQGAFVNQQLKNP